MPLLSDVVGEGIMFFGLYVRFIHPSVYLFLFVHSFIWTDSVTMMSH